MTISPKTFASAFILMLLETLLLNPQRALPQSQPPTPTCTQCPTWGIPQTPFKIHGNTYYVGTHGLSSILITSDAGLVLIDGTLEQAVPQIVANIRTLGFRIEDVKLILNSHAHYDHAGGIAELQRLSGATVVASKWSAAVLTKGDVARDDPQYGALLPTTPITHIRTLRDGEVLHLGKLALTPHATPGHTPGGTSWTWQSCDAGHCLNLVYMDSLSPVSADRFKYTKRHWPLSDAGLRAQSHLSREPLPATSSSLLTRRLHIYGTASTSEIRE